MPPAARVTDMHVCPMVTVLVPHVGGPILPPGVPTVLIDFLPAATVTDMATCVGPPDVIVMGSTGVFINFLPAARLGDPTAHGGVITLGSPTCIIGEVGSPSPGTAGLAGVNMGLAVSFAGFLLRAVRSLFSSPGDDPDKERRQEGGLKVWPGQQHFGNCGVQSAGEIIAAVTGKKPDEDALLHQSVQDGDASKGLTQDTTGGTNPANRQAILKRYGIDSDVEPTTVDNLAAAIKANKGIIATVNPGLLWDDTQYAKDSHAILVYDGDFDSQGNLTAVYINDTGDGQQGRLMPIDEFMSAANANPGGSFLNVTDKAIW